MTDPFAVRPTAGTIRVSAVTKRGWQAWLARQPKPVRAWLASIEFKPDAGKTALVPGKGGALGRVVLGLGDEPDLWAYAGLASKLPAGKYAYDDTLGSEAGTVAALGWALASYRFGRYKPAPGKPAQLVWPKGADRAEVLRTSEAIALGRDLVNTPAGDLGTRELCAAVESLAKRHRAKCTVIEGAALLERNYPTIHAVGRASSRPPAIADLRWGDPKAPKLTLVGKGVVFDSGGLDLKTASGMKLMKKDMGGAASMLALAHMIMDAGLRVRLRVLIPTVENSVSADAYRPGDVIRTRKGITVEIGNTDAEGRLILCDALAEADSEEPDLLIDFATLTGAARVALGTELPALFSSDDDVANAVLAAGREIADPLWPLPLFAAYRRHLDSPIADMNNVGGISEGGAITAALFLREFVGKKTRWMHVDTMAWNVASRPGRPHGGDVPGVRAFFRALQRRYG